jgi:SAM-dependent methyltransferase
MNLNALLRPLHQPVYARRVRELVRLIAPHLRAGDSVLDVGCGSGALGRALLESPLSPEGIRVTGIERVARPGAAIPVETYSGTRFPIVDADRDVVILADVLHHEMDPHSLLAECVRVSRRLVIVKDHQTRGWLAYRRLCVMDWAANRPYGVPCLYRYNRPEEWREWRTRHGLQTLEERHSLALYPPVVNLLFGGSLHYFAVLTTTTS